ncbi:unnamed protein product [Vicia faba]|uniref:Receptor-like protein 51 n=1 Tax=Vicia faba TaxID=3906 RepID=A0AAV0YXS6_VICFA|nr:unnamed protein product [Vicia faba]
MKKPLLFILFLSLSLSLSTTITTSPPSTSTPSKSTLDPKQITALQSLNIPTSKDPCSQPSFHNATLCDSSKPFRHLISLTLSNCSSYVSLSFTALKSLSTLTSLNLIDCPISPIHFPPQLISSLKTFTCINSLRRVSGVWLSQLQNLTDLTVSNVQVKASGPYVILGHMNYLKTLTLSHANLTGFLPAHIHSNLTHVDFSDSISALPALLHLDLSSNQLNGSIPMFISQMKSIKYLNLANNNLHGVVPFNLTFIKGLEVFKLGGNSNLCYNHSLLSSKLKLGVSPCDKYGKPVSPPPSKDSSADDSSDDDYDDSDDDGSSKHKKDNHHGPNKFVLGVAIALSSIVFLIVFLIVCSKCCR